MTTIKFCGLTRPEDAAYAAELGASHIGVVFAPSPRKISFSTARKIYDVAGPTLQHVGVFADSSAEEVAEIAKEVKLDVVQLHQEIDDSFMDTLRRSFAGDIWPVIGVEDARKAIKQVEEVPIRANGIVLDTSIRGKSGGTGKTFDWAALSPLMAREPRVTALIVAGGLTPQNVGTVISAFSPDIVDVSSGVESETGIKDHQLMKAFAEAVHSASIV
ncbi:MAG TPA: phosphoribosylanthranilate isomerase [Gemmatimonadaceae bacterium]|nr:phosphoribosylanthranilate isomerase [Gemmatimonadaceae bacterium]